MHWIVLVFHVVIAPLAIAHALLYKRDSRAALGWIGISLVFPVAGPLLYFFFGVNLLRIRARQLAGERLLFVNFGYERGELRPPRTAPPERDTALLAHAGWSATGNPLCHGNRVELLENGDAFYPALIESIRGAETWVCLSSYIFSGKGIGADICAVLRDAATRGVRVYVLVDGVGALYSFRSAEKQLKRSPVRFAYFHPPHLLPPSLHLNLRNHRKLALIDGRHAFFGGLNIDDRHFVQQPRISKPHEDLHFHAEGPLLSQLTAVFCKDWHIATGEALSFELPGTEYGAVRARAIEDGPDESLDRLAMTLLGLFSGARERIRIMTPYFIPSRELTGALQAAAVRGVKVELILPDRSNLIYVDWATRHLLWEFLQWGVELRFKGAPFAHTKLITIDDEYVLGGSANLDPRSLRLNFEIGVEMFDCEFAAAANVHFNKHWQAARPVSLEELDRRSVPVRLRDGFFWLFSAYL